MIDCNGNINDLTFPYTKPLDYYNYVNIDRHPIVSLKYFIVYINNIKIFILFSELISM